MLGRGQTGSSQNRQTNPELWRPNLKSRNTNKVLKTPEKATQQTGRERVEHMDLNRKDTDETHQGGGRLPAPL